MSHDITEMLGRLDRGETRTAQQLLDLVYPRLKQIAERQMRQERASHTLQATALVNEAYLELFDAHERNWESRAHFFAYAASVMRHILVRHARSRNAKKRGGDQLRVTLEGLAEDGASAVDLISLDAVLTQLAQLNERQARLVELRFFGGLSIKEIASVTHLSTATVNKSLRAARGWLYHQLRDD